MLVNELHSFGCIFDPWDNTIWSRFEIDWYAFSKATSPSSKMQAKEKLGSSERDCTCFSERLKKSFMTTILGSAGRIPNLSHSLSLISALLYNFIASGTFLNQGKKQGKKSNPFRFQKSVQIEEKVDKETVPTHYHNVLEKKRREIQGETHCSIYVANTKHSAFLATKNFGM